jgi:organic radical activating enzyme
MNGFMSIVSQKKTLSIMLTYTCPAECKDCGTLSSPRSRENITLEDAKKFILEASEAGDFSVVVFTGGEATLRWKDLLRAIAFSKSKGLATRLVTNAHWAFREDIARQKLRALIDAGLDEINYSTGDEHTRFIPLDRVGLATRLALEAELTTCVMIESKAERKVTRESLLTHKELLSLDENILVKLAITESPWMPLDPMTVESYSDGMAVTAENIDAQKPCHVVLSTYTVQGDGRIGACCGLGMRQTDELNVGRVTDRLDDMRRRAESDLFLLAIRYLGPLYLLKWAASEDASIKWEGMYAHHCQACSRIYTDAAVKRFLFSHISELKERVMSAVTFDESIGRKFVSPSTYTVM